FFLKCSDAFTMAVLTFKVLGMTIVLLLLFAYGALFPNQPPSISTPEGETKGGIDVPAIGTSRFGTPYPTYQFASWAGGGISITSSASTNDLKWQQQYIPAASAIFPWGGISYSNWCAHANTTTTRISGSGEVYSSGT